MKKFAFLVALLLTTVGSARGESAAVTIPVGAAPTIDGVLADGEWDGALQVSLDPGGEAWLRADDTALYVAVKVGQNCIPSLALVRDETVKILHASASLGTAEYERSGSGWKATRGFEWQCREGRTTDEDRKRFLEAEGWFGTTCGVGRRGEAEYRIERRLFPEETPRLALVVCRLQPMPFAACAWPSTIQDGTRNQDLLMGQTPGLSFDPESWACLEFGEAGTPADRFEKRLETLAATTEPVEAYRGLLDLLDAHPDLAAGHAGAKKLRTTLEKKKAVQAEKAAQRRLEKALELARKKLLEVETKYPGTRAAERARARREALEG